MKTFFDKLEKNIYNNCEVTNDQFIILFTANVMNGNVEKIVAPNMAKPPEKQRDWKLLIDPCLTGKKEPKVYRFEGLVPGEVQSNVITRDPRSRVTALAKRYDILDLPVPR
jgi:hypothetical protein